MATGPHIQGKLKPSEITVHFNDSPGTSKDLLAACKALGLDVGLTAGQIDKIRARLPELRKRVANDPVRCDEFIHDPVRVLAELDGKTPPADRQRQTADVRWRGVGRRSDAAEGGAAVAEWALAAPGRLALLRSDPRAAIDAALAGRPRRVRDQLVELATKKTAKETPMRVSPRSKTRAKKKGAR